MRCKYFYTDSVAIAWMAKHFGMKFVGRYGETCAWDNNGANSWVPMPLSKSCRVFLHHESLDILEPKTGDLALGKTGEIWVVDSGGTLQDYRIIRRNGILIIQPEVCV